MDVLPDPSDRYVMFTQDGSIIGVEEWEIDMLNDDELVAYLTSQSKKGEFSTLEWILLGLGTFLLALSLFILFWNIMTPFAIVPWILPIALLVLDVAIFYTFRQETRDRIQRQDYTLNEGNPFLLDALRKLASNPNIPSDVSREYAQRIQNIKNEMSKR